MNKQRFDLLIRVAEMHEADAARKLAEDTATLRASEAKLQQLLGYQADYAQGMATGASLGYGAHFRDHCLFNNRLDKAIKAQRQQIDQHDCSVETSRQGWQEARKRIAILNKVGDRARSAHRALEDKRDQKWLDELAGAAHLRASRATSN